MREPKAGISTQPNNHLIADLLLDHTPAIYHGPLTAQLKYLFQEDFQVGQTHAVILVIRA